MNRVLVCIDVQNDFVDGTLGTKEAKAIVSNIKKKIEEYQKREDEIIFTRDTHYANYLDTLEGQKLPVEHCIYRTKGWNIVDGLEVPNCAYVNKRTFGCVEWWNRTWMSEEIEVCGLCTDICVISNALIIRAMFPSTKIIVDASCCAGTTPERHKAALEVMKSCQINVVGE